MSIPRRSAELAKLPPGTLGRLCRVNAGPPVLERMWRNIERRSAELAPRAARSRAARLCMVMLAAIAAAGLAGLALSHVRFEHGLESVALSTRAGARFEGLEPGPSAQVIELADGSRIEAAPGTQLLAVASTEHRFELRLARGKAKFVVEPGGPRRWMIEAEEVRVEVVGTVLTVERGVKGVTVQVESGAVLVRSRSLPDGAQRLQAGQSLYLPSPDASASEAAQHAAGVPSAEPVQPPKDSGMPVAPARSPAAAEPTPDLWAQADEARAAGEPEKAARLLERLLEEPASHPQAALAAYTLGLLELEDLEQPAAAARHFQQAIASTRLEALREMAHVRLAQALHQSGDRAGLEQALRRYQRLHPSGRSSDMMRRWLQRVREEKP